MNIPIDHHPKLPSKLSLSTGSIFMRHQKQKLGHRKVDERGHVTFKTIETSQICEALQLGINRSVGKSDVPERDVLMKDFLDVEVIDFPQCGTNTTQPHNLNDFRFKSYAPNAFRYFRELFGIPTEDYLMSICNKPLRELSNPGASGSVLYKTTDDRFIIKTVTQKESHFLRKLLSKYFMNLHQNPDTLLPKFYGLYCHTIGGHRVRVVVMNNLLPSKIRVDLKFDLKGSSYKREASEMERNKNCPTLKDLDFVNYHPKGIYLEPGTYESLTKTIKRDCTVLESFNIMDYSFLIGIHQFECTNPKEDSGTYNDPNDGSQKKEKNVYADDEVMEQKRIEKKRDQIDSDLNPIEVGSDGEETLPQSLPSPSTLSMHDPQIFLNTSNQFGNSLGICTYLPPDVITGRTADGESILLFCGIIDILQSYELNKKIEHSFKSMLTDGNIISVTRPDYYATRFQDFLGNQVFKKDTSFLSNNLEVHKAAMANNLRFVQRKINTPLLHTSVLCLASSVLSIASSFDDLSNYYRKSSVCSVPSVPTIRNHQTYEHLKKDFRNVNFNRALEEEMMSRKNNLTLNNAITRERLSFHNGRLETLGSTAFDDRSLFEGSVFEEAMCQCSHSIENNLKKNENAAEEQTVR